MAPGLLRGILSTPVPLLVGVHAEPRRTLSAKLQVIFAACDFYSQSDKGAVVVDAQTAIPGTVSRSTGVVAASDRIPIRAAGPSNLWNCAIG
jgi:hypothetical protein